MKSSLVNLIQHTQKSSKQLDCEKRQNYKNEIILVSDFKQAKHFISLSQTIQHDLIQKSFLVCMM